MSEASKNILREANAAVERGDHAGFLEHCTEDTVWTFLGDRTESPRFLRRLNTLRGLSHEEVEQVLTRGA